ncbi:MAG: glycosyltransferase [Ignavibacteriae bacterium]|nr:glycosyltransferase [Ignavibacteriota bacterium]
MIERVSVIIPNYNYARYLAGRIESILQQTTPVDEVIILDDASTDDSRQIIQRYTGDTRVRAVYFDENSGSPYRRWNDGAALATGEWLLFAGADDNCDPTMIARLLAASTSSDGVDLVWCQSTGINENGDETRSWKSWTDDLNPTLWSGDFSMRGSGLLAYFLQKNVIPNASAVLLRRSAFLRHGGFDTTLRLCADWMLYARIAAEAHVAFVADPLNHFRTHGATVRDASSRSGLHLREAAMVIGTISSWPAVENGARDAAIRRFVRTWMSNGVRNKTLLTAAQLSTLVRAFGPHAARVRWELVRAFPSLVKRRVHARVFPAGDAA